MGDLNRSTVRQALITGLSPIKRRVTALGDKQLTQTWSQFSKVSSKSLLDGEITVDEWKGVFGDFCTRLAGTVGGDEGEMILAEANGAATVVEEAFDPPSPLRWWLLGGAAVTVLAYWWVKRDEKEREKLAIATPEIVAGSPRKKRPATELGTEEAVFEEI